MSTSQKFPLSSAKRGDKLEIVAVDDMSARLQALRFGLSSGSKVSCSTCISKGPVVLKSGRQEIAIGRGLAEKISVRKIDCERCDTNE